MTWTPEIVRARFTEAADTERYLPRPLTASGRGYWPPFIHDIEDQAGWDDAAKQDNAKRPATRAPAGAIGRHEECMRWSSERINDETRRHLVWGYARCQAFKMDFSKLCHRRGWKKSTAYDRLNKIWDRLSDEFCNERLVLQMPAEIWLDTDTPEIIVSAASSGEPRQIKPAIPFTPAFILERATDLIRTDNDVDNFAKFLSERNALMRKEQARRRKLGMVETSPAM